MDQCIPQRGCSCWLHLELAGKGSTAAGTHSFGGQCPCLGDNGFDLRKAVELRGIGLGCERGAQCLDWIHPWPVGPGARDWLVQSQYVGS